MDLAVQSNGRLFWRLDAVLEPEVLTLSRLHSDVPFDPSGVLVKFSASERCGFDLYVLVIGQRKLVVDDDADGQFFSGCPP